MHYKITITKMQDNPDYEKEMAEFKERHGFYGRSMSDMRSEPVREIEKEALFVILDDRQFDAVKKAVLEQF